MYTLNTFCLEKLNVKKLIWNIEIRLEQSAYDTLFDGGAWQDEDGAPKEKRGVEQKAEAQRWKSNVPKDLLQNIRGPITRATIKAMKKALNHVIRDLKELEPIYLEVASFNMPNKMMYKAHVKSRLKNSLKIPKHLPWRRNKSDVQDTSRSI